MPIEHACLKEVGVDRHKLSALELHRMCHDYALKWINIQREEVQEAAASKAIGIILTSP